MTELNSHLYSRCNRGGRSCFMHNIVGTTTACIWKARFKRRALASIDRSTSNHECDDIIPLDLFMSLYYLLEI